MTQYMGAEIVSGAAIKGTFSTEFQELANNIKAKQEFVEKAAELAAVQGRA